MSIKNIIFDLGGVLLEFNPQKIVSHYLTNDEDINAVVQCVFQSDIWAELDRGVVREEDVILYAKQHLPERLHAGIENLFHHWYTHFTEIEGADIFVRNLISRGYHVYLLSNINDKFYIIKEQLKVLKHFPDFVISSDIHINKPAPGIYTHLLEKFNLSADECLFLDDREVNVIGARAVGMHSEIFTSYNDPNLQQYVS